MGIGAGVLLSFLGFGIGVAAGVIAAAFVFAGGLE